ncbi:MAG: cytochrome b N-terminal domain-containing protein [Pseudomonadota bacterium]|jgi:ubiquinol-cytochrome c reductase cytochrome b subunit|nr:cytochrome b [Gammaproteobacteria bacterium]MEC8421944.1 cytochrome b N-terminal domain-containing protein [Pseudomonadota bacterium]|tara:strand:+ start:684 stop:2081 length:1398 start_codon:yes stop_codon:yes gene_type:complete
MSNNTESTSGVIGWIDARLPILSFIKNHLTNYYAPKNFNFWYFFGSLAFLVLFLQIVTGIFLAMHYKPDAQMAFDSVEFIMRDVNMGWLIRYMHSTGASAFFIIIYLHMFRALMYGSFKKPRELIWLFGVFIYLALMAEAFMGYLLPWGQMSFWGAQVIINLFSTIPFIGEDLAIWIRGDFAISDPTLTRFFALHIVAVPMLLLLLVLLHLAALHTVGSNNPDGVEIKDHKDKNGVPLDGVPFHPYYTIKDMVGIGVFLFIFSIVVFYAPEMGGYFLEHANFVPANALVTPEHIAPVWYFTPFYSILRAIPDPQFGALAMLLSIIVLFFLPWIDTNPIKSIRYRSTLFKVNLFIFVIAFMILGWLGVKAVTPLYSELALRFSQVYFLFFILLYFYSSSRNKIFTYIFTATILGIIFIYDFFRLAGADLTYLSVGFLSLVLYVIFMFMSPIFTQLNSEKQVPSRVT